MQTLLARHLTRDPSRLRAQAAGAVLLHPVTQLGISATAIRAMLSKGESPRFLLPDQVLSYMQQERLYH